MRRHAHSSPCRAWALRHMQNGIFKQKVGGEIQSQRWVQLVVEFKFTVREALASIFSEKRKIKCSTPKGGCCPAGDLRITVAKRSETENTQREGTFDELSVHDKRGQAMDFQNLVLIFMFFWCLIGLSMVRCWLMSVHKPPRERVELIERDQSP